MPGRIAFCNEILESIIIWLLLFNIKRAFIEIGSNAKYRLLKDINKRGCDLIIFSRSKPAVMVVFN